MKRIGSVSIWVMAGLQLGCNGCSGAATTQNVVAVPDQVRPSGSEEFPPSRESDPVIVAAERGHTFQPVPHPPHTFASYRPLSEAQLPRLVQRSGCFAAEKSQTVQPYPPSPRPPRPYYGTSRPQSAAKGRASSRPESLASGEGSMGGSAADYEKKAEAPAAAPPAPAPEAAGPRSVDQAAAAPQRKMPATDERDRTRETAKSDDVSARAREPRRDVEQERPLARDTYHDWGAALYLSNDDTMSLSSAQRVIYAIDHGLAIPPDHMRPHEFLNYFSFDAAPVAATDDFSVHASIAAKPTSDGIYTLGLSVNGRDVTRETRRNAGLTLVIDRSGSMAAEGRMEYLKQGLRRMTSELKNGDLVNLVLFDDAVCTPLENFVVGRDSTQILEQTISRIQPRGSTNLEAGLAQGYRLANDAYQDAFTNRVVLISDAIANTGVTDPGLISTVTESYDKRRIRLSGVGVGRDFNDELLDRLTEKGKGAYVFLGSEAEVDAVFGSRFVSLIETVANDVHFRLHLPPSLRMNVFYGEESSVVKSDVQAIHYFAGTNQLFLSDLMAKNGTLNVRDDIMLTVEYENPETGVQQVEEFAFNLGRISGAAHNLNKGRLLMSFIDGLKDIELAQREGSLGRDINYAAEQCAAGRDALQAQAETLRRDPEVDRVLSLWQHYCARYPEAPKVVRAPQPEPNGAVHRAPPRGNDVWPGAR